MIYDDLRKEINRRISADDIIKPLFEVMCKKASYNVNKEMYQSRYKGTTYFVKLHNYIEAKGKARRYAKSHWLNKYSSYEDYPSPKIVTETYNKLQADVVECQRLKNQAIYE